jgi:hypothetical protein
MKEVTIDIERLRALRDAREFLFRLTDPKAAPRIPRKVRIEALQLLKNYPDDVWLVEVGGSLAEWGPDESGREFRLNEDDE